MAETQQVPPELEPTPAPQQVGMSKEVMGMWVGAAVGFGIGMVFALGGFWAGLLCVLFTIVGAILGRVFLTV